MTWSESLSLLIFVAICTATASSGAIFKPGDWYETLRKPTWNPPKWAFPVIWTIHFTCIAVAGWIVWETAGLAAWPAFLLYGLQLALNAGWSAVFFGLRRMDLAAWEVIALWFAIAANVAAFAQISTTAALLMTPYLLFVIFAAALTWTVWRLNPNASRQ